MAFRGDPSRIRDVGRSQARESRRTERVESRLIRDNDGSHSQAGFDVRLDWGAAGLADIGVNVEAVVVVDVLSFTTAVEVACSRGARISVSLDRCASR